MVHIGDRSSERKSTDLVETLPSLWWATLADMISSGGCWMGSGGIL